MIFQRKNIYYKELLHYLKTFKEVSNSTYKTIDDQINYLKERLNKESATDTTCILVLEKQKDKFDYWDKYIEILIKYFEEL